MSILVSAELLKKSKHLSYLYIDSSLLSYSVIHIKSFEEIFKMNSVEKYYYITTFLEFSKIYDIPLFFPMISHENLTNSVKLGMIILLYPPKYENF